MFPEERKKLIIELLHQNNSEKVKDLALKFNVSKETIRRDLEDLQKKNIIKKTYGMATLLEKDQNVYVLSVQERKTKEQKEKMAIAREAIKLIKNNNCILLDAGSTTEYIGRKIKYLTNYKDLSIITNGINVAHEISKIEIDNIYSVGGKLRRNTLSVVGSQTIQEIKSYNIDIAFLGTTGISIEDGFSSSNIYEVEAKRAMVSTAKIVVIVADHTKFEKHGLKTFCRWDDIDYFVSSNLIESSIINRIERKYPEKLKLAQLKPVMSYLK